MYYKLLPVFEKYGRQFDEKNQFSQKSNFFIFYVGNACALSRWAQKYLIFVSTLIFKVTVRSKVKKVKTGSRIIFVDFHIDSYRFWVAESEYDVRFALRLILTSQWRHKHVSLFLCLKWPCSHKESIIIFEDFYIDSYRFWVAESEYDVRFTLRIILTSQGRHKHVSLFLCLKRLWPQKWCGVSYQL